MIGLLQTPGEQPVDWRASFLSGRIIKFKRIVSFQIIVLICMQPSDNAIGWSSIPTNNGGLCSASVSRFSYLLY